MKTNANLSRLFQERAEQADGKAETIVEMYDGYDGNEAWGVSIPSPSEGEIKYAGLARTRGVGGPRQMPNVQFRKIRAISPSR
jgi:hypothetical protein